MNNHDLSEKSSALKNEVAAAKRLLGILEDEFQALNNRATAIEINHITSRKSEELLHMEKTSQQRAALISSTDPLLSTEPLKSPWQSLRKLAQACQYQNQINGSIINIAKHHVAQAAAILHGQQPTTNLSYASSGKAVTERTQRPIAKA